MKKPRARNLGLKFPGQPGKKNSLTDIKGVLVGHSTLINDEPGFRRKPVRTGVTAILPFGLDPIPRPVWAGHFCLNGNGEMTGTHWINDGGYFFGPICITNTHSVGMVHHATTKWMIDTYADNFEGEYVWAMPVVAETYDGVLNDINGQHVTEDHVFEAINNANSGIPEEGNVGGGTGMICYEFKGGVGTSSRIVEIAGEIYTVAAQVQANHGMRDWLTVLGVPVGKELRDNLLLERELGSIIVILGTDAPLSPLYLNNLARRAALGIGRSGTPGGNNSGDIFLSFSVANKQKLPELSPAKQSFEILNGELMDPIYLAAMEATDEAVINALIAAESMTTVSPPGMTCAAIDHQQLCDVMHKFGRLE